EWVGLPDILWAYLQTDLKGVRIPCLSEFSEEELIGFLEGIHCTRRLLDHLHKGENKAFDEFETSLMLVEVAARRQLRQFSCAAPILRITEEAEAQSSPAAKRAGDFAAQLSSTTTPDSLVGHG